MIPPRKLKPPLREVCHRALPEIAGEALGKARARQSRDRRELVQCPRMRGSLVQLRKRATHARVGNASKPARPLRRELQHVATQRLREQHFRQTPNDHVGARHAALELLDRVVDHAL